jgi:hypothetical protein
MDRRPSINKQQAHVSKMRLVLMRPCESSSSPAIAILLGRQHPLSYSTTFPLVSPPTTKTTSQPTASPQPPTEQPMRAYQEEFAVVCDRMWSSVISVKREKALLAQSGRVAIRAMDSLKVTAIDQRNYRRQVGLVNSRYNRTYPAHPVVSLDPIQVHSGSIDKPKGHHARIRQLYIGEVERSMAEQE